MNIYLLTHQRELERSSNTGGLVADLLADGCKLYIWDRVRPDLELLEKIADESVALLYPSEGSACINEHEVFDSYIILDSTWQEAQKMYNHSPYLKRLKKVHLNSGNASIYTLRRNQKEMGLCTAECVVEVLNSNGYLQQGRELLVHLKAFILNSQSRGRERL